MPKARCIVSQTNNPFINLAIEDWIFRDMSQNEHILFLWRNDKSVIIGRNQNPWAECDLKKMQENNINLVRRESGGGAVYQDLGNSIFTFLSPKSEYDRKRNFQIIINALAKFGIKAEQGGRNDILVDGKKISGSAFKENPEKAFHHGTLLINVDLEALSNYLTPAPKKLLSKGTTSVRARVANLTEFNQHVSHEIISEAIIEEFFKTHNSAINVENLDTNTISKISQLNEYHDFLKSDSWRFGETPQFQHQLNERFDWATIDLHLNTDSGKITKSKIFSDCLDPKFIEEIEKSLHNLEYHPQKIIGKLELLKINLPNSKDQITDLQSWIQRELN